MKKRILPILSVFIFCIVLTGAAALLYATFFAAQKYDTAITAGRFEVAMRPSDGAVTVEPDGSILADAALITAGDRYEMPFTLTNLSDSAAFCAPRLTLEADTGLSHVLLVRLDGEYVGVLGDLAGEDGVATLSARWLLTKVGTSSSAQSHTLMLEYHVGAGEFFRDKTCRVRLDCVAVQTLNADGYAFVSDEYSFRQAVGSVNAGKLDKIVLCDDITLNRSVVLDRPASLDLSGRVLTVAADCELKFSYADARPSALNDSVGGGALRGAVVFDTPASYVSGTVDVAPRLDAYGAEKLAADYEVFLRGALRGALASERTVGLVGAFGYYDSVLDVQSSDPAVAALSERSLRPVGTSPLPRSAFVRVQVSGAALCVVSFTVAGTTDERMLDEIESEFYFAAAAQTVRFWKTDAEGSAAGQSEEERACSLASHILLPSAVRAYGARVRWISEDLAVLGGDGRFAAPALTNVRVGSADGTPAYRFRLTAVIDVNGQSFARTYTMYASTVSPAEKLSRLVMRYSPLVFSEVGQSQPLPKIEDYAGTGFSSLTFAFDETLFEAKDNALILKRDTTQTEATVRVRAVVYGETVEDTLDVLILLKHSESIFEKVLEYIDGVIAELPPNVIDSFELPSSYDQTVTIEYRIVDPDTHAPLDPPPAYIAFARKAEADPWTVTIDAYRLPNVNVKLCVEARMVFDNGTAHQEDSRYFELAVGGVYHNTAQDVPDVSLYYALMRAYNADGDDFLTVDEVNAGVAANPVLSVPGKNIVELKGVEFLRGLTELDLSHNRIESLDALGGLTTLTKLNVASNRIRVISSLADTSLTELNLSHNLVTDISALAALPLRALDLTSNSINGFAAIETMTRLATLKTTGNPGAGSETNDFYFIRLSSATGAVIERTNGRYLPTAAQIAAMNRLSALSPVYEIEDVLFLPASAGGSAVTWSTNSEYAEIVTFDNGSGRVFVTQPMADVSISIGAKITVSGATMTRYFVILSREGAYQQKINGVDARAAVPDAALRYELFRLYGNPIALDASNDTPRSAALDLSGKGVADLTGLELFAGKFTAIDLTSADLGTDAWATLARMTGLKTLRIGGVPLELGAFSKLAGLEELWLFGCTGTEDAAQIAYLRALYDGGTNIYPDGATRWNPYEDDLVKALSYLDRYYVLTWNGAKATLPSTLTIPNTGDRVTLSYSAVAGALYTLSGNTLGMAQSNISAEDVQYGLSAAASYRGAQATVFLTVVMPTEREMLVKAQSKKDTYEYRNLYESMPDAAARRTVLKQFTGKLYNGAPYIDFAELNKISSITFNGAGDHGVKGLELFNLTNLASVKVYGYTSRYASGDVGGFSAYCSAGSEGGTLENPRLPKLVSVAFENSTANLADLTRLTALTALDLVRCMSVGLYAGTASVFETLVNVTTVKMIDCDLTDTYAFRALKRADTIWLYNNPISDYYAEFNEDMTYAYGNLMSNVTGAVYDYRVSGKEIQWTAGSVSNISFAGSAGGETVNLEEGLGALNYVDGNLEITLPQAVAIGGQSVPLAALGAGGETIGAWSSSAPALLRLAGDGFPTAFAIDPAQAEGAPYGYALLTLRVVNNSSDNGYPVISATLYYAFLVRNPAVTDSGTNLDFRDFLDGDGRARDERFLNYAAGTLAVTHPSANGVFSKADARAVPYFVDVDSPTAASNANVYKGYNAVKQLQGVTDLGGIRNFTGVYYLNLSNNSVGDLSELRYLVNMEALYLQNSPASTFETHFTQEEIAAADVWTKRPSNGAIVTINQNYTDAPRQGIFDYMAKLHVLNTQYASAITDYAPISWRVGVSAAYASAPDAAASAEAEEAARLDATKKLANLGFITTLVGTNTYLEYGPDHYFEAYAAHYAARTESNRLGLLDNKAETDTYISHTSYPSGDTHKNFANTRYNFLNTVDSFADMTYAHTDDLEKIFLANNVLASYERQLKLAAAKASAEAGSPVAPLTVRMTQRTVGGQAETIYAFEDLTTPGVTAHFASGATYLDAEGTPVEDGAGGAITAEILWHEHLGKQDKLKSTQSANTDTTYFDFTKAPVWGIKNSSLFYSGEQTIKMKAYVAVSVVTAYGTTRVATVPRVLDVRVVKDTVEGGGSASGQTIGARVELTAKEAAVYAARGVSVTDGSGAAYAGVAAGLFYASSAALIPDSTFRNQIYEALGLTEPTVTLDMRSGYNGAQFDGGANMIFSSLGVYDITGFELFTRVSYWSFDNAFLTRVPEVPVSPFRTASDGSTAVNALAYLNFSGCRYLTDLAGLAYDADGTGSDYAPLKDLPRLSNMVFTSAVGVGNAQLAYLFPLKAKDGILWNIRIDGTSITDYSFMTTPEFRKLRFAESGLGITNSAAYINYGKNYDDIKYMYLTNQKQDLFLEGAAPSMIVGDKISIFYGELRSRFDAGETAALTSEFMMYGTKFGVAYAPAADADYIAETTGENTEFFAKIAQDEGYGKGARFAVLTYASGLPYLSVDAGAPEAFVLDATSVYRNPETGADERTFTEKLTVLTGEGGSGGNVAEEFPTEGRVELADGRIVDLAQAVPSPELRYHFLRDADADGDKTVTRAEQAAVTSLKLFAGTAHEARVVCRDLSGIELFSNLTALQVGVCSLESLAPLASLVSLQTLSVYNLTRIADFSFLEPLTALRTLTLTGSDYADLNFLFSADGLISVGGITTGNTPYAAYVRTAIAYARIHGALRDDDSAIGNADANESTADEKVAADLLSRIEVPAAYRAGKTAAQANRLEFGLGGTVADLPGTVRFRTPAHDGEVDYAVTWQSLSPYLVFDGGVLTAAASDGKTVAGMVATVEYHGARYDRYYYTLL